MSFPPAISSPLFLRNSTITDISPFPHVPGTRYQALVQLVIYLCKNTGGKSGVFEAFEKCVGVGDENKKLYICSTSGIEKPLKINKYKSTNKRALHSE